MLTGFFFFFEYFPSPECKVLRKIMVVTEVSRQMKKSFENTTCSHTHVFPANKCHHQSTHRLMPFTRNYYFCSVSDTTIPSAWIMKLCETQFMPLGRGSLRKI